MTFPGTIAFSKYSAGTGTWSIWTMNADGTNQSHLVDVGASQTYLSWSPGGSKLAYQKAIPPFGDCVFTINADGTGETQLPYDTSGGYAGDTQPFWCPNGKILLSYVNNPATQGTNICIMNADGSGRTTLLTGSGNDRNLEPRMRADGKITFMRSVAGTGFLQIWVMNANGTGANQLTSESANHGDPVWSPDGSKIAFGSDREGGGRTNIFTINADGSNLQQLSYFNLPYEAGDTGWTSDGLYICFEWDINGQGQSDPNAHAEVWILTVNGSRIPWSTDAVGAGVGCNPRFKPSVTSPAALTLKGSVPTRTP